MFFAQLWTDLVTYYWLNITIGLRFMVLYAAFFVSLIFVLVIAKTVFMAYKKHLKNK